MLKRATCIILAVMTAACGKVEGTERKGRPVPTPTPPPAIGAQLRVSPGNVKSSASGVAMRATASNIRNRMGAAGMGAEISVGGPGKLKK